MRGNTFGKLFSVTSFGESHGSHMGAVIDGVPGNLEFSLTDLQNELKRRSPGRLTGTTTRKEEDLAEVVSGIFEGKTLGTPICVLIKNTNAKSSDYDQLKNEYRPGHADKTTLLKYGIRDHRGGGRSSGRETVSRVIGGYFASLIIPNVQITAAISKLGEFEFHNKLDATLNLGEYSLLDSNKESEVKNYLVGLQKEGNSVGGKIQVHISNCMPGLGEPCFDKLKADLSKAMLSIGSCVGFTYGIGEDFVNLSGKETTEDQSNFGGIEGGISNGNEITFELSFRAPSTVGKKALEGRHDPCILPRVVPAVESMAKVVIADHFLRQKAYS